MLGVSFNPEHQLNCEPSLQMTKAQTASVFPIGDSETQDILCTEIAHRGICIPLSGLLF